MSRSILDRYDRAGALEARADKLAGAELAGPVHIACTQVLGELIHMASTLSHEQVPAPMRAALKTIDRLQAMMLEGLVDVPEERIKEFMRGMIAKLQSIIDADLTEEGGARAALGPGADRATA